MGHFEKTPDKMDPLFYFDTEPHTGLHKESAWSDPDDEIQASTTSTYNFGKHHIINNIQPRFKARSEPTFIKCPVTSLMLFKLTEGLLIIGTGQILKYDSVQNSFESFNSLKKPSSLISSLYKAETAVLVSKKSVTVRNIFNVGSKIDIAIRDIRSGEAVDERIMLLKSDGTLSIYSLKDGEELYCLHLNSPITFFKCDTNSESIFGITKHSIFSLDLRSLAIRETKLQEGTQTCGFCLTKSKAVVGYSSGSISVHSLLDFGANIEINLLRVPVDMLIGDSCSENFLIWNVKTKGSLRVVSEEGKPFQIPALRFKKVSSAVILNEDKVVIGTNKSELFWHCIN